jgi:hypothetical protein
MLLAITLKRSLHLHWWVPHGLRKRVCVAATTKTRCQKKNFKAGIEITNQSLSLEPYKLTKKLVLQLCQNLLHAI